MSKSVSLTEGSVFKGLLLFALPILLSNLFQQLYNAIDSAVVGLYAGTDALAAVGGTGSLINLIIGFFLGIATGTSVLYAMHYGAQDYPGLKKLIDSAMFICLGAAVLITTGGVCGARTFLLWMGTPVDDVLPLAARYLRIFFAGSISTLVYNVGAGILRAEGDSLRPLLYLAAGGVSNLLLDLLLVAALGLGVAGAALATVAAQTISALLVLRRLTRLDARYALRPLHMKFDRLAAWDILRISLPCGLQGSMFSISNLLVQTKINTFGALAMAGTTAYTKIDGFIYMPIGALSFAVSTYVGQNIGAAKFDRIGCGIRICMGMALFCGLSMCALVYCFCPAILPLFTKDPAAQAVSLSMMRHLAPFAWIFSFSDILGGAIRGAGQATKVMLISALSICLFRIVWLAAALPLHNALETVFLCYPISWVLSTSAMLLFYFRFSVVRKTIHSHAPQREQAVCS